MADRRDRLILARRIEFSVVSGEEEGGVVVLINTKRDGRTARKENCDVWTNDDFTNPAT